MTRPGLALSIRTARPLTRTLGVGALVVVAGGLSTGFALEQAGGDSLAWWWPAAGVGVIAAAASPQRWRWATALAIGLASGLASVAAGRPLLVAGLGALGAALEAWVIALAVTVDDDRPRLTTLADVGRFAGAAVAGAAIVAALIGIGREFTGGGFTEVFWAIFASHISALVLIAPLGLIAIPVTMFGPRWRSIVLLMAMLATTVLAFWPGTPIGIPILPIPLMAWAAVTEPMFFVAIELLAVVATAAGLTAAGGGILPQLSEQIPTATALQIFAVALAATTLTISATQNDRRAVENTQSAISHLLHDAFRQSKSGFVILQDESQGRYSVLEINAAAVVTLRNEFERIESGRWVLRDTASLRPWLDAATIDLSVSVDWEAVSPGNQPATITIDTVSKPGLDRVLLVSVQDLRPLREAEREMEWRLERERQVSRTFQALNQQKVDFVASVTHELRTPITSILGFAEELNESAEDPELQEHVRIILRNATRLRGVIDDVLLVSKLSRGPLTAEILPVSDAGAALRRSIEDAKHSIAHQHLVVDVDVAPDLLVRARESDLTRVFTNILTNAIKFSPDGATISVGAHRSEHEVVITITDQGEGISDEDLAHIFDRFYRSSSSTKRGVPGTGLGLSIVKELLAVMNGRIELTRAEPVGTRACITIVHAEHEDAPRPAAVE